MIPAPRSILMTGASSGIGEALAVHYAARNITLFLSGRDAARLEDVAGRCRDKGAIVYPKVMDVRAQNDMRQWIAECDHIQALDLVVANAGISGGTGAGHESEAQVREIFDINVNGVFNTVHPAIDMMRPRKAGQIAVIASLAGFSGWPGAPAYSASKGAVRLYAEGLHAALKPDGIVVTAVCPGFVESRMTAVNPYKMPFLMDSARAAKIIVKGLLKGPARLSFPYQTYAMAGTIGMLPAWISVRLLARLPKKPPTLTT